MLKGFPRLKAALKQVAMPSANVGTSVELLQAIPGIGRNLATKLLAMHQPEKFVVVNEPVESALRAFRYEVEVGTHITGAGYRRFLRDLGVFIDKCESAGFKAAPALDAFFYTYKDTPAMNDP